MYTDVLDDSENWVVEQQPGGEVNFENGTLEIIDAEGCTVWFRTSWKATSE